MSNFKYYLFLRFFYVVLFCFVPCNKDIKNEKTKIVVSQGVKLEWKQLKSGKWGLGKIVLKNEQKSIDPKQLDVGITLIYSEKAPLKTADKDYDSIMSKIFIEGIYKYNRKEFDRALNRVSLNKDGIAKTFYPDSIFVNNNKARLTYNTEYGIIYSDWDITDYEKISDIRIGIYFTPSKEGYYSIGTPGLINTKKEDMAWATIPGYFQGDKFQSDFALAYAYGHGVPESPVVFRDRCATTLTSIVSRTDGVTLAAIAEPGFGRDPWENEKNTHLNWNVGLSVIDRDNNLAPTLYYPVLGENR